MDNNVTADQVLCEEDAALLVAAHMDLVATQAEGTRVLGSTAGRELVARAHATVTADLPVVVLTLPLGDDELLVPLPIDRPNFVTAPAAARNEVSR